MAANKAPPVGAVSNDPSAVTVPPSAVDGSSLVARADEPTRTIPAPPPIETHHPPKKRKVPGRSKKGGLRGKLRHRAQEREKVSLAKDDMQLAFDAKVWTMRSRGLSIPEIGKVLEVRDTRRLWEALDRWRKKLTDTCVDYAAIERHVLIGQIDITNKKLFARFMSAESTSELCALTNTIRGNVETIARMQGHNAPIEIKDATQSGEATPERARQLINDLFVGAKAAEIRKQVEAGLGVVGGSKHDAPGAEPETPAEGVGSGGCVATDVLPVPTGNAPGLGPVRGPK